MSYLSTILADTPAGFWRLAEPSGTVATDDSGNARPGSYTGTPSLGNPGPLADGTTAMVADGVDDLMDVPDDAAFDGVGDFSIEIWFKTSGLSDANGKLFWKRLGGNGYALHLTASTGTLTFECETGSANNQLNTSGTNYQDGAWHHVVATRSGANGRIYVDGSLVAGPTGLTANSLANTAVVRIASNDTVTRRFVGSLFGVAYYGAALTGTQIAAHYAARGATVSDAYLALLASPAPDFVILAEIQPMEPLRTWTNAGGGTPNTWYCAFASQVQTTVVAGGLYRRLDFVRQDATTLTPRASAALVEANPGSYFYDTTTARIYVRTTGSLSPDAYALVGAWFTIFFATRSVSLAPLYEPRITGDLPSLSAEMPDALFGATVSTAGTLQLLNGDALFDRLVPMWVWRNKSVTLKLGGATLASADYATVATLRINKIAVDDALATLTLEDVGSLLNRTMPFKTWGDGTWLGFVRTEQDLGKPQPILFGTMKDIPLFLGNPGLGTGPSVYYTIDSTTDLQPFGITIDAVYAMSKTTGARTTLTLSDWADLGSGYRIAIANYATYPDADYDFIADVRDQSGAEAKSNTCGKFAKALLVRLGESITNINADSFDVCDGLAPQELGWLVFESTTAADVLRMLEQTVGAQVYRAADGRWTMRLIDMGLPASATTLSDTDFAQWEPEEIFAGVLSEVRVRYDFRPYSGDSSEASSSADRTKYGSETFDGHTILSVLPSGSDASATANHLRFAYETPAHRITFEERGLTLMNAQAGDRVYVTRTRAPVARTGRYDSHVLRIVKIQKALGPVTPIVSGVLDDLGGQTDHIFRLVASGSTLTWATASVVERAQYGFLADTNGYLDSTDPLTRLGKVLV